MDEFCRFYVHDGWTMIAASFALLFAASIVIWRFAKPKMTLPVFLYHVFNYRARFAVFASPEARARFKEPAVSAAVGTAVAVVVFNVLALAACPGSILYGM